MTTTSAAISRPDRPAHPDPAAAAWANVRDFLGRRGLTPDELRDTVLPKVGVARHLLVTSSPVHGLANATSDIDLIRVQDEPLSGPRMAVQLFEGDQHLEVISFSADEVAAALAGLETLAGAPAWRQAEGYRRWDSGSEVRRKYLERIVNGVTLDGDMPYRGHLPALGAVWRSAAFAAAAEQVVYLALAEAAGERRGGVGYAVNALLYIMDAVLSEHGDVYSNRKWYLLRWRRLITGPAPVRTPELADKVERMRRELGASLRGTADAALTPSNVALMRSLCAALGEPPAVVVAELADGVERREFLPGAELVFGPAGCLPVAAGADLTGTFVLDEGLRVAPARAAGLLRAARAGIVRCRLGPG